MNDFERQMQQVLRRSERDIDDQTIQELASARTAALSARNKQRVPRFFVPATGMALASILAVVLIMSPDMMERTSTSGGQEEVLLGESMDLYEDMDFYYWLAREDSNLQG